VAAERFGTVSSQACTSLSETGISSMNSNSDIRGIVWLDELEQLGEKSFNN